MGQDDGFSQPDAEGLRPPHRPAPAGRPRTERGLRAIWCAISVGTLLHCAAPSLAADLIIRVIGLRSGAGDIHYAVYDRADGFPSYDGRIAKGEAPADMEGTVIHVTGLKPGTYAVAVFHDENGNGVFDQGFLGIPLEDYGFSNNASGFLGPPSFRAAAFPLSEPETEIVIDVSR